MRNISKSCASQDLRYIYIHNLLPASSGLTGKGGSTRSLSRAAHPPFGLYRIRSSASMQMPEFNDRIKDNSAGD